MTEPENHTCPLCSRTSIVRYHRDKARDQKAFRTWHYITDPAHIGYFSKSTFHWLAGRWALMGIPATLVIAGNDVVLIEKG